MLESIKGVKEELEEIKTGLVERGIHKNEDNKPKKVYIGMKF